MSPFEIALIATAAFAAGAECVGFQIGGINLEFAGFINFGDDIDAGEAGVAALI